MSEQPRTFNLIPSSSPPPFRLPETLYAESEVEIEIETLTDEENETDPLDQGELEIEQPVLGPVPLEYSREDTENHVTAETETVASSNNVEGTDSDKQQ